MWSIMHDAGEAITTLPLKVGLETQNIEVNSKQNKD